ncbi:hypothetical protein [Streptomyces sp. NPDC002537]
MSSSRRFVGAAFCAAALATTAVPAHAGDTAPVPAVPHRTPVLVDCLRHDQVRPREYMVSCADGNNGLRGLGWTDWTDHAGHGTGQQVVNDCLPSCAEGRFHTYRVSVETYRPVARPHGKAPYFSRLKVTYLGDRPSGSGPSQTYPLG